MLPICGPRDPRASLAYDNLVIRQLGKCFLRGRSVNRLCRPYSLVATTELGRCSSKAAMDNRYVSECLLIHLYKDRRRPVACGVGWPHHMFRADQVWVLPYHSLLPAVKWGEQPWLFSMAILNIRHNPIKHSEKNIPYWVWAAPMLSGILVKHTTSICLNNHWICLYKHFL